MKNRTATSQETKRLEHSSTAAEDLARTMFAYAIVFLWAFLAAGRIDGPERDKACVFYSHLVVGSFLIMCLARTSHEEDALDNKADILSDPPSYEARVSVVKRKTDESFVEKQIHKRPKLCEHSNAEGGAQAGAENSNAESSAAEHLTERGTNLMASILLVIVIFVVGYVAVIFITGLFATIVICYVTWLFGEGGGGAEGGAEDGK